MFEEHFKIFAQNIEFAARALSYHLCLNETASTNKKVAKVLDDNARFWIDYRFMTLQTVVIFLGKIFSKDMGSYKVHNIDKVVQSAAEHLSYFSKSELEKRKGEIPDKEAYFATVSELSSEDILSILDQVDKAEKIWNSTSLRALRDKFFAHSEMLTPEHISKLLSEAKYDDIENLVQILLNISFAFEQAFTNGRKPSFISVADPSFPELSDDYKGPLNRACAEIKKIFDRL